MRTFLTRVFHSVTAVVLPPPGRRSESLTLGICNFADTALTWDAASTTGVNEVGLCRNTGQTVAQVTLMDGAIFEKSDPRTHLLRDFSRPLK